MLKEITIKNLYNFKNEVTFDFTTRSEDNNIYRSYNNDNISVTSLIYGKNNVGKSNFFRIIDELSKFVLNNEMILTPYKPFYDNEVSEIEVIFDNGINEIRYGVHINMMKSLIEDEYMFSKINNSSRESRIFERGVSYFPTIHLDKLERYNAESINDNTLIIHSLNNLESNNPLITQTLEFFNSITLVNCNKPNANNFENLVDTFLDLSKSKQKLEILNTFLEASDLDIKEIKISVVNEKSVKVLKNLKELFQSDLSSKEKDESLTELISNNPEELKMIVEKHLIENKTADNKTSTFAIEFVHRSGQAYMYDDLSSGTKQLINVASTIINHTDKNSLILFDEIESGLHMDLLDLIVQLIKLVSKQSQTIQFIITTHVASLLDYDFISKDNKIFMKLLKDLGNIEISYLSEYKMREYHTPSKRYNLDAFKTNPNTHEEYKLYKYFESDGENIV